MKFDGRRIPANFQRIATSERAGRENELSSGLGAADPGVSLAVSGNAGVLFVEDRACFSSTKSRTLRRNTSRRMIISMTDRMRMREQN